MWDDERIEAALDEAARELTAGDPGPEFRARVMARIERAPRFQLGWRPMAAGLAVAAMVVVAVIVGLRPRLVDQTRLAEVRLKPDAPYSTTPDTQGVRLPPSPPGGDGVQRRPDTGKVRLKPDTTYRSKPDALYGEGVAPLTTTPIELESIALPALTADESLRIDPLPPAPSIAVAPLVAEPEGDRR